MPDSPPPILLRYALDGAFRVENSPADRVPSHGTWLWGTGYAIDLVPVDDRGRSRSRTGNHVIIRLPEPDAFVLIAHLRRSSIRVQRGDHVREGQEIGACGNSGNSTEPHVHVQVTAGLPSPHVDALPLAFRDGGTPRMPRSGEIVRT